MPGTTYPAAFEGIPPFPDDVETVPLLVIDYELVKNGDENEINRLWEAATTLGFWYLKNHGADETMLSSMFAMGSEVMNLPTEEKMKYDQGNNGISHGYKQPGNVNTDATGKNQDSAEFINISKDDALAYPGPLPKLKMGYPAPAETAMEAAIKPFIRQSVEVNDTVLEVFNRKLGLKEGTLARKHNAYSGSEARCIRTPPAPADVSPDKVALLAHTDFGSLSFLHNRLGGLQVLPPGHTKWLYVRPMPGHAICNVGDSLAIFSGGVLQSNIHRVVPPPGDQRAHERWSLVFFTRPNDDERLRPLVDDQLPGSTLIQEGLAKKPGLTQTEETAGEWLARRTKMQRTANIKSAKDFLASRGTEHTQVA
ncbi:Clavaminate synthase-like protein [Coniophora puteana RWD-64-598 SS2]|uniref:Clavaminate synthase-like protein n=1 Tax=Coniophora puteana (strain RWD-64-598) TaxID=741705 RepID=A0A5M3N7L8_CONPW|nr:Clavaminate synthase-like protein [Coniophora puteana RWD-64-598 SS2]EIW87439.1 Clavaminate synthase-like protein [Coniophora puteana RWD-64-598 SS2]